MNQEIVNLHQDIIDQCLAGNRSAQYELYGLYSKAMFNVSLRMVNNRDEAEDILQDAFVSAFTNLGNYRGEASFGSWLKRIVVNKCIDHLHKKRAIMVPVEDEGIDVVEETRHTNESEIQFAVEKVREGMAALPHGFRSVLTLYLFEGYDHKEIAGIMGISESTSKSQYLRAKAKLRTILENKLNYG